MIQPLSGPPKPLRAIGGTAFERRLLEAAAREQPSRELCARMAQAIGVSAPAPSVGGAGPAGSASTAAPKAAASLSFVPWISGAAAAAVVATIIVAMRPGTTSAPDGRPGVATIGVQAPEARSVVPTLSAQTPEPLESAHAPKGEPVAGEPAAVVGEPPPSASMPSVPARGRANSPAADLRDEITLVEAARVAVSSRANERALEILRQYQSKYPAGSFRPEATALRIEALANLGRRAEARALAEQFVTKYGASPLADRVARLTGLSGP